MPSKDTDKDTDMDHLAGWLDINTDTDSDSGVLNPNEWIHLHMHDCVVDIRDLFCGF